MEEQKILPRGSFPSLGDLLVLFGLFFVIQIGVTLLAVVLLLFAGRGVGDLSSQETGIYVAATSFVSMLLATVLFVAYGRVRNNPLTSWGLAFRRFDPMLLVWGYLLLVALGVVTEPLYNLLPPLDQRVGSGIWAFMAVVVIAPCFEEFLCRGFLYGALRLRYGLWPAILLSALFFGLLHLQPVAVVNAFLIGLVLGYLYACTATLWAPIALHALNNATAFLLLMTHLGDRGLSDLLAGRMWLYGILYVAALALLIFSALQLLKRGKVGCEAEKNAPSK